MLDTHINRITFTRHGVNKRNKKVNLGYRRCSETCMRLNFHSWKFDYMYKISNYVFNTRSHTPIFLFFCCFVFPIIVILIVSWAWFWGWIKLYEHFCKMYFVDQFHSFSTLYGRDEESGDRLFTLCFQASWYLLHVHQAPYP